MTFQIATVTAMEILDSRGNPTVEVELVSDAGLRARAAVPSGASTGTREAVERRDGDKQRFGGKGVSGAVAAVCGEICSAVRGMDCRDQRGIDNTLVTLDGTANKSRLGANALLGVSLAVCRLAALSAGLPLYAYLGGTGASLMPVPCMNILNGGVHARWQGADFQEYMIAPLGAPSLRDAVRWGSEVYQALRRVAGSRPFRQSGRRRGFRPLGFLQPAAAGTDPPGCGKSRLPAGRRYRRLHGPGGHSLSQGRALSSQDGETRSQR